MLCLLSSPRAAPFFSGIHLAFTCRRKFLISEALAECNHDKYPSIQPPQPLSLSELPRTFFCHITQAALQKAPAASIPNQPNRQLNSRITSTASSSYAPPIAVPQHQHSTPWRPLLSSPEWELELDVSDHNVPPSSLNSNSPPKKWHPDEPSPPTSSPPPSSPQPSKRTPPPKSPLPREQSPSAQPGSYPTPP